MLRAIAPKSPQPFALCPTPRNALLDAGQRRAPGDSVGEMPDSEREEMGAVPPQQRAVVLIDEKTKRHHAAIESLDRREIVKLLAATWRAHSGSGVGDHPGSFTIEEDDEKVTFTMNPCGSGQRLVRKGLYESQGYGKTREAHDWSYGRKDFPLYCTHCSFMNESMPIQWSGFPSTRRTPPRTTRRIPALGTGTRTATPSRRATGSATGRSSRAPDQLPASAKVLSPPPPSIGMHAPVM